MPDHAGFHYNLSVLATLAGDTGDETFDHLRRSVELFPPFASRRAGTMTSLPHATTAVRRGSSLSAGLDLQRAETKEVRRGVPEHWPSRRPGILRVYDSL